MAPAQKMQCKNNSQYTYTGKEMSPLGLGICADAETVGTQMVGRDNKTWIVGVKNNDKIWIRAPEKPVLVKEEPVLNSDSEDKPEVEETEKKSESEEVKTAPEAEKPKRKYTKKTKEAAEPEAAQPEAAEPEEFNIQTNELFEKPKRKYTKKTKAVDSESTKENTNTEEVKPKRKYTKKSAKVIEGDEPVVEKKTHAKRGPSGYNLFIGKKISELRLEQTGLKTTEYMKMAQDIWREMSKEEQTEVSKVLKEEYVTANA